MPQRIAARGKKRTRSCSATPGAERNIRERAGAVRHNTFAPRVLGLSFSNHDYSADGFDHAFPPGYTPSSPGIQLLSARAAGIDQQRAAQAAAGDELGGNGGPRPSARPVAFQ